MNEQIKKHPMFSESDFQYFKDKGYSDAEVINFWDRDHAKGCEPVVHRPVPCSHEVEHGFGAPECRWCGKTESEF